MSKELLQQALVHLENACMPAPSFLAEIRAHLAAQPLHEQLREMGEAHAAQPAPSNQSSGNPGELNLMAAQPAPAEPVAHAQNPKDGFWVWCLADEPGAIPLYTHPAAQPAPVPVPLTDEQIDALYINGTKHWIGKRHIARAIEAAHGIAASPEVP
jgi:hypothetical protein